VALSDALLPALPVRRSRYLDDLLSDADRLAALLRPTQPEPPTESAPGGRTRTQLVTDRQDAAARTTVALDGGRVDELPTLAAATSLVGDALAAGVPEVGPDPGAEEDAAGRGAGRVGTWLDALRGFADPSDDQVRGFEVVGAAAALASDDLVTPLVEAPRPTLTELHRRLTRGLVAADRVGALRRYERSVQDGSVGRVIFFTTVPDAIGPELDRLLGWLTTAAVREHPVAVSGIVHLELLRIHPFDAANGRLSRSAARLLLRRGGLDPDGLAAPEPVLVRDALGYHEEVASTLRRRDPTRWLERWAEAVADGLRHSGRELGLVGGRIPSLSQRFLAELTEAGFTVADHRAATGLDPEPAQQELTDLLDAGLIERVPGTGGLRYLRVSA
jgi:hypothetical protein